VVKPHLVTASFAFLKVIIITDCKLYY